VISGRTRIFGLVGHPVRHSLSPEIHTALFARLGVDAIYVAFDVDPRRAGHVAQAVRTLDLVGVNLTAPFKEAVLPHLDELTIAAREAGAVNVVINIDGTLTGYNTDGAGLLASLDEELGLDPAGRRCVVLGAGGTGRAVASSLVVAGARVTLLNRNAPRAQRAAEAIGCEAGELLPAAFARAAEGAELVVSCVAAGAEALIESLPVEPLAPGAVWVDVNYWMAEPPRFAAARARGLRTLGGLGMLLHQAALSFELFTGYPVRAQDLRDVLEGRAG
jgi:shikimate dehydrogenase